MRRRTFVGAVLAGLGTPRAAQPKAGDIPMRVLGRTGVKLTVVGQGGARFHLIPFEEGKALVRRAFDLGIDYFDMARSYAEGRAEDVYGAVIPEFRKEVFLTTKSGQRTRQGAEADLETSLKRMRTDCVDLWQIHGVNNMNDLACTFAPGGAIETFEAAKKAGKCRFIGYSKLELMGSAKEVDKAVQKRSRADFAAFRARFAEFDAEPRARLDPASNFVAHRVRTRPVPHGTNRRPDRKPRPEEILNAGRSSRRAMSGAPNHLLCRSPLPVQGL